MDFVSRMMDLYALIDKSVAEFQLRSGLRCPAGCGICCPDAEVEATVLEMLPLAQQIFSSDQTDAWLVRLAENGQPYRCLCYSDDTLTNGLGHCGTYALRPSLCRLFGFSSVRNRLGQKKLAVCRQIKQHTPEMAASAAAIADQAPCFVDFSSMIYAIDPVLGARPLPINTALEQAIRRVGLRLSFEHWQMLSDNPAA